MMKLFCMIGIHIYNITFIPQAFNKHGDITSWYHRYECKYCKAVKK